MIPRKTIDKIVCKMNCKINYNHLEIMQETFYTSLFQNNYKLQGIFFNSKILIEIHLTLRNNSTTTYQFISISFRVDKSDTTNCTKCTKVVPFVSL